MASDSSAFTALADNLSQGDIVQGVPWAVLEYPLTVCRQTGKQNDGATQAWFRPIAGAKPPAFHKGPEIIHALGREPGLGIVIWEDCQIDKMRNQQQDERKWFVAVAPVVPMSIVQSEDHRQAIRDLRRRAFFPLPALPALAVPESYVDLRLMWPVRQSMLTDRVTTLSPESRSALYGHLLRFLTGRTLIADVTCPSCQAVISSDAILGAAVEEP
jgi:hypothetical protein